MAAEQEKGLISVKEFAQELGITEQAVYKRLKNPNSDLQQYLVTENEKKFLKVEALEVERNRSENSSTKKIDPWSSELESYKEMVELLREQLQTKDKQIESLQNQNEQLTDALKNTTSSLQASQLLHANTMKAIAENTGGEAAEETPKKKKFFERLFG